MLNIYVVFCRYLAICKPLTNFVERTNKLSRVIRTIVFIWVISLLLAIPQAAQFGVVDEVSKAFIIIAIFCKILSEMKIYGLLKPAITPCHKLLAYM